MAFVADVSPRLITKLEADPDNYVLKSDTMAKISAGLNVPAFMLFFPEDVAMLNRMLSGTLARILMEREATILSQDSMVSMFLRPQSSDGASAPQQRSPAANKR